MKKFDIERNPKTFAYVLENDTVNRRCNRCGSVVLKETNIKNYPYQCMSCDDNLYETETHIGADHTDEEFDKLCMDTLILELDNELENEKEIKVMTREMIMGELKSRGYEVQSTDVIKNGTVLKGIIIGTGNIRPTIYTDRYNDANNVKLVVDEIVKLYEDSQKNTPVFDVNNLMNWEYVKTRLQLCIQRKGNEDIVKKDFLDLEQYVRVFVTEDSSFKIKPEHLEKYRVTEDELFNAAWDCTKPTLTVTDMLEIIAGMMGTDIEILKDETPIDMIQYVFSNKNKVHGAIAMCDTEMLSRIAERYNTDLAILPSSIHECIVMPVDVTTNFSKLNTMVSEVNETQVEPEEQLSDHAYRFNRETRELTF